MNPPRSLRWFVAIIASLFVSCSGATGPLEERASLTVGAAASTATVMKQIGAAYIAEYPEVELNFTFAASGVLVHQLEQGAPLDALVFADLQTLDKAKRSGIQIDAIQEVARNRLLIVVPSRTANQVFNIGDLAGEMTSKISVGNPEYVPLGRYSRSALQQLGIWDAVLGKAILAGSAAQAREYVRRGEVEGAVLYGSDVWLLGDNVVVVEDLTGLASPVYVAGVLGASEQAEAAARFVAFLSSDIAQSLFLQHGFVPVEGAPG